MPDRLPSLAITGASGFLGGHLLAACMAHGHRGIRLLTRGQQAVRLPVAEGVTICEGDLLQPETLDRFLAPASTLIHLAYLKQGREANLVATNNLAEAAVRCGVQRVIHCSTAVVVGSAARGLVTEETIAAPADEYQHTKYDIELALRAALLPGVELAILRPTEIIGPGGEGLRRLIVRLRDQPRFVNALRHALFRHRRFNYVSVHNVVAALLLLARYPAPQRGDVYQVSDDDDPDNYYAGVEAIVDSQLNRARWPQWDVGLTRSWLAKGFQLMGRPAPDRVYSHAKLDVLGYRKVTAMDPAIREVLSFEGFTR